MDLAAPSNASKKRLVFIFVVVLMVLILLIGRLGYIQIVMGEELKKEALEQWTKGIEIKAKRGIIYDRNGKKLAISVNSYTVWASPADIKEPKETAKSVAEVLDMDEDDIFDRITKIQRTVKIKQWITKEEANDLRKLKLAGIEIVDDNKRFYPYEDFASYIIGFTNIDSDGQYGIEKTYDKYLSGTPGRWVKTTDAGGRQMPYDQEQIYEAQNGLNVVTTIDETIQHFAEKAAMESLIVNKAKNVSIIVMEPSTGDILAMANLPQYNPNDPRQPLDDDVKKQWESLPLEELKNKWFDMWRNFAINDAYEPGSTFKTIVAAAAIEENVANMNTNFYCNGFVRDIPGAILRCSKWYDPHGSQTLKEGLANSCNIVFVNLARNLGKEKFYKYVKAFGFGETTGIELTGEQGGIIPAGTDDIKEIRLATMSYGHGIAVTPLQLINAISAIGNGGNLMVPRIVSRLIDDEGNIVHINEPKVKRQVLSKSTARDMLEMMESVVIDGTGTSAYVPGYRIAGKTGTAEKIIDGRYAPGKYIGSFLALAPASNPRIAVLVIVDEPSGVYYGGSVAAPVAAKIIEETLSYLDIKPHFTEEEKEQFENMEEVPDLHNNTIEEAGRKLTELGFKYTTETDYIMENSKVIDQFPLPGTKVVRGSIIDLYLEEDYKKPERIKMPDLTGKSKDNVIEILNNLSLKYKLQGDGVVIGQNPKPGVEVDLNSIIEVEFSGAKE